LLVLVENSGHIVGKDALMKKVWCDTFVEEANLTVNISSLRKVLNADSHEPQFIETIPKRGYRFIAPVTGLPDEIADPVAKKHTQVETNFPIAASSMNATLRQHRSSPHGGTKNPKILTEERHGKEAERNAATR